MHQLEEVALGADVTFLQPMLEIGEYAIERVELRTSRREEDALGLELGQHCVDRFFIVFSLRIEMDPMHVCDEVRLFRDLEIPSMVSHSLHCFE